MVEAPCTFLPWDTYFFGFRIGRVNGHILTDEYYRLVEDWCKDQSIRCLYFLADSDDAVTVRVVEKAGFHFADVRVTLERSLSNYTVPDRLPDGLVVRPHQVADLPALKATASNGYTLSRFYFDEGFPRQKCSEMYEVWVRKSFDGYADEVLVAELNLQPVGYITLNVKDTMGEISLVGISPAAQGQGIGKILVAQSLEWFNQRGQKSVEVVTQGRNIRAQRLYQREGFVTKIVQLWYHKWF